MILPCSLKPYLQTFFLLEEWQRIVNNNPMQKKDYKGLQGKKKAKAAAKPAGMSDKVIRLLRIYTQIAQNRYPSVSDLQNQFEVSERTVRRYLANINLIDSIEFDPQSEGYRFVHGDRIKKLLLSEDDFLMLITMGETLTHFGNPFKASFQRFADKLTDIAKTPTNKAPQVLIKIPDVSGSDKLTDTFNVIMQGINEKRSIDVLYHALHTGQEKNRRIDPYGVVFHEGAWMLIGYCHLQQAIRTFALDMIKELKLTNFYFKRADDFDLKQHLSASWGIRDDQPVEVVVRFASKIADYITRKDKWHPSEKRTILKNGDIELSFTVAGVEEIKRWLYAWLPNVQVVKPEWFREQVKKELAEATKQHKKGLAETRTGDQKEKSPYKRSTGLIGKEGSGRGDLSLNGKEIFREMLRKKHNARR